MNLFAIFVIPVFLFYCFHVRYAHYRDFSEYDCCQDCLGAGWWAAAGQVGLNCEGCKS